LEFAYILYNVAKLQCVRSTQVRPTTELFG